MLETGLTPEHPIAPVLYQETLERLDLQTICLDHIEAFCDRENFDRTAISLSLVAEAQDDQNATHYSICISYIMEGRREEIIYLRIKAVYRLVFRNSEPIPPGFFEVFQELNLRMLTLPYFRELVASLTGRMELPTITVPLNIFAAASDEESNPPEKTKRSPKRIKKDNRTA